MAWAKLKAYLRKRAERTGDRVRRAVQWGRRTIRHSDGSHWFTHAGYHQ